MHIIMNIRISKTGSVECHLSFRNRGCTIMKSMT